MPPAKKFQALRKFKAGGEWTLQSRPAERKLVSGSLVHPGGVIISIIKDKKKKFISCKQNKNPAVIH